MKNKVKKMAKDAMTIGVTGVGLGAMGLAAGESDYPTGLGTLGKGVGKVGGIVMVGHGMKILSNIVPKKKGKW